ncbi:unnamed protein product [Phytophthora fragariaefolia]|uniref:Unnamed protein product n=1 Tax=Phytophthora fragariaefolia TaxID=1490495 RepID=A0A9W6X9Q1_9STRA|nr:unnamed protein product [Phytophthora fragariaefolia]
MLSEIEARDKDEDSGDDETAADDDGDESKYFLICARHRLVLPGASCGRMVTEAVLYTTVAAVHRHRQDRQLTEPDALAMPAAVLEAARNRRILPPCTWQPVSFGAWAQVHICVEIDQQTSEACFRIVVWILESGTIVVNDILGTECCWWRSACDDIAFRRLTGPGDPFIDFDALCLMGTGVLKLVKKLMRANIDLQSVSFGLDLLHHRLWLMMQQLVMAWQGLGLHSIHYPARAPRIYSETTPSSPSSSRIADLSPHRTLPKEEEDSPPSCEEQQENLRQQQLEFGERPNSTDYDRAISEDLKMCNADAMEEHNNQIDEYIDHKETSPIALLEASGGIDMGSGVPTQKRSRGEWISRPYKLRVGTHVTYNAEFARFEGLPDAWRKLNQQFGLPLEMVLKREVEGYESKLPAVLVMMKTCFLAHNGARTEGVFRLAPDKQEYTAVKHSINDALPTLHQAVTLWLLDLMNEVVQYEHENWMTAKSMGTAYPQISMPSSRVAKLLYFRTSAIVMAPNLLSIKGAEAAVVVAAYRQVADFVQLLLHARQQVAASNRAQLDDKYSHDI